jgi:hypothetical protein
MSPDTRILPPEGSQEKLKNLLSSWIRFPGEEEIRMLNRNLTVIPTGEQNNPFVVTIKSKDYGSLTVPIPGVYGDNNSTLAHYIKKTDPTKIWAFRSTGEGLLNIHHPSATQYSKLGKLTEIHLYSKGYFQDFPNSFKCFSFLRGFPGRDIPPQQLNGSFKHQYEFLSENNNFLTFTKSDLDGYHLSEADFQMEEIQLLHDNKAVELCFRPKNLPEYIEKGYEYLRSTAVPYRYPTFIFSEVPALDITY